MEGEKVQITSIATEDEYLDEETTIDPKETNGAADDNITLTNNGWSNKITHAKVVIQLVVMCIGFLSNILSFSVIVKQGLIKAGVWVYFAAIAVNDNLNIIWMFIFNFSGEPINLIEDVRTKNDVSCKILNSGAYFWGVLGVYILVIMTCERCLIILNPYRIPPSQKRAIMSVIITTILSVGSYSSFVSQAFGIIEVPLDGGTLKICSLLPNYAKYSTIFTWANLTVLFLLPAGILVLANAGIVFALMKRARNKTIQRDRSKVKSDLKITYLCVISSMFFVITVSPTALYGTILWEYFYDSYEEAFAFDNLAWSICGYFAMLYYVGKFWLYIMSGEIFRKEARKFLVSSVKCNGAQGVGINHRGAGNT